VSLRAPELDTACLSDALDRLGIAGQAEGILPMIVGATARGRAFTVRLAPTTGRGGTVGDFIDDVPEGSVVVLDNGGRRDATVWGDLLTEAALRRGVSGVVIHGVCRDIDRIRTVGLPLFCRGVYMRTGKDRVRAQAVGETVSLGTASVAPGDIVVGDGNGVVVIPADYEQAVMESAREIAATEARIRSRIEAGDTLREARTAEGYHGLQRRGNG
jgi:4-hydroxy-4-methyl-2-oxoglutarate aldolase